MSTKRGILKHDTPVVEPPSKKLAWDEEALQITEATRGGKMKVTEPKTPWVKYDQHTDQVLGHTGNVPHLEIEALQMPDSTMEPISLEKEVESSPEAEPDEWQDDEEEEEPEMTEEETQKHAEFEKHRKSHYDMHNILAMGRKLAEEVDEDEEESEEERKEEEGSEEEL